MTNTADRHVGRRHPAGLGGEDYIVGRASADELSGNDGRDRAYSEDGNDTIDGGAGADRLFGGPDEDVIFGALRQRHHTHGRGRRDRRGPLRLRHRHGIRGPEG